DDLSVSYKNRNSPVLHYLQEINVSVTCLLGLIEDITMRFIIACSMLLVAVWGADAMSQSQIMECAMVAMAPEVQQYCQQELTSNPAFGKLLQSGRPMCEVMLEATDMSHSCISSQIKSKPKCNDPAIDSSLEQGKAVARETIEASYCKKEDKRSVDDLEAAHIAEIAVNTVAANI
ncbi:unnamed protein product, partial [Owenia fusiformis]